MGGVWGTQGGIRSVESLRCNQERNGGRCFACRIIQIQRNCGAFNNFYNSTLQLFIIHVASFISKHSIARKTCSAARGRRACSCVTRMRCFRSDQRKNKWYGVEGADEECQLGSQSIPWLLTGQVWSSILVPGKCAATCDCRTRRGSLQLGGGAEDSHNIACGRM